MKLEIEGRAVATVPSGPNSYVPVRHLCEHLGLNTAAQVRRLKKAAWAELRFLPHSTTKGKPRQMAMIPVDSIPCFVASLDNNGWDAKRDSLLKSARLALHNRDGVRVGDIFAADEDTVVSQVALGSIYERIIKFTTQREAEEEARREERRFPRAA